MAGGITLQQGEALTEEALSKQQALAAGEIGNSARILIKFFLRHQEDWRVAEELWVEPSDRLLVEEVAEKYTSRGQFLFNIELWPLAPSECFEAAIANGTNTILLLPEERIDITHRLFSSLTVFSREGTLKRRSTDDISEPDHINKRLNRQLRKDSSKDG